MGRRGELFSAKATSEKRVFFFNVKENRRGDMFLNIVESKRSEDAGEADRHQIIVYQEEMDDFYSAMTEAVEHVRSLRWNAFRERRAHAKQQERPAEVHTYRPQEAAHAGDEGLPAEDPAAAAGDAAAGDAAAPRKIKKKVRLRRGKSGGESETAPDAE